MSGWSVTGLLEGKSTIVTGAGKGIGRACALEFARQGALVTLCDIDEGHGRATTDEIAAYIRSGRAVNLPEFSRAKQVKVFYGQAELIAVATRVAGTLFHPKIVLASEHAVPAAG